MPGLKESHKTELAPTSTTRSVPFTCKWEDLSKHDKEDDCWVAVDGKVYDVTSWIPKHPGGKEMIMLSAGRDITNLFESYHIMSDNPTQILKKYYVGDISNTEFPRYTSKSPFYSTLRTRVVEHLKHNVVDTQNTISMWSRVILCFVLVIASYYAAYFSPLVSSGTDNSIVFVILFAIVHGLCEALYAAHVTHDASHAAVSHNPNVWKFLGACSDILLGVSFFSWNHQHVIGHHLYTNIRGADPDIGDHDTDFRRVSPSQRWVWVYRYQHIYGPILYGLLAFKNKLQDWQSFILRTNGPIRILNLSSFNVVIYLLGKVMFIATRIIIPLCFCSISHVLMVIVVVELTIGYYLAFVFQVSHVAGGLDFYTASTEPGTPVSDIDDDWAIVQVRTTQDYAHGSKLTTFLTGSLNYQVVHHLFPSLSQDNYPMIAPIVKQTCDEFGVRYQILPTFWEAFTSHLRYLKMMGLPPPPTAPTQHYTTNSNNNNNTKIKAA